MNHPPPTRLNWPLFIAIALGAWMWWVLLGWFVRLLRHAALP